jgi:hypothetical protein
MGAAGNRYRILPTCRTNTRLFDTPPEQGGNTFPSLNVTVENSTTFTTRNGIRENGVSEKQAKNGVSEQTNGVSEKKNGAKEAQDRKEETKRRASLAAPEVNNFTSIMMKEMFLQKEERETVDQVYKDLRDMSSSDFEQVDRYWDKLLPVVSFLGTEKVTKIYDALRVAYRAHRGQMR